MPRCPLNANRQVAITEVEPDLLPEFAQAVHHPEGVALETPAASVDLVGQPEADQVGVRGDVGPVDLNVIAGVRDHDQALAADNVKHPAGELRAPGAPRQHDHWPAHRQGPGV
jgi:hypothetical protein